MLAQRSSKSWIPSISLPLDIQRATGINNVFINTQFIDMHNIALTLIHSQMGLISFCTCLSRLYRVASLSQPLHSSLRIPTLYASTIPSLKTTTHYPKGGIQIDLSATTTMASLTPTTTDLTSKRRRFQAPITNFFPAHPTQPEDAETPSLSYNHYSAPTSSPTPIISPKEQASLLSVGMRIRKAVPEGYKTKQPGKMSADFHKSYGQSVSGAMGYTELAPFCGMSKSDDRLVQSFGDPYDTTTTITNDEGDAFSLPSSQESASSSCAGMKRPCDPEVIDDESSLDLGITGAASIAGRPVLAPSLVRQRQVLAAVQNRNLPVPRSGGMEVDDFEEADFLKRREEVDSDYLLRRV